MVGSTCMKEAKISKILIIVIFFLGVFSATSLVQLMKYKNIIIDTKNINLLDMYIKATSAFFGTLFSSIFTITMFWYKESRKKNEEIEKEERYYSLLHNEWLNNKDTLAKFNSVLISSGLPTFSADFQTSNETREVVELAFLELEFNSYKEYKNKIFIAQASEVLGELGKMYQLASIIRFLLDKNQTEAGTINTIEIISEKLSNIDTRTENDS